MSKGVTPRSTDYARWYTDVIQKAQLADYGPVKGTMVIRPYGFSIWESIKDAFDRRFRETGHVNAYFPLFIPKSFLSREAEHVEGFAKECAVVTHTRLRAVPGGTGIEVDPDSKLEEEIVIRPTSETVIWAMYKKWINSYRDLPLLINQWANVVRWEMRTRLFLRTSEFLWQEGHTAHASAREAREETLRILDIYREVIEQVMAVPVITGLKSESEKFAGAVETYTVEAMMGDRRALQAGTSHYLGQNFARAFDVSFQNENNEQELVYATSWGVSTRLVGALIMAHGDDKGLRLPPLVAPVQAVVVPIFRDDSKDQVLSSGKELVDRLTAAGVRAHLDDRDTHSPGFKFNDWEMKGVPVRIEIGPKDIARQSAVVVRRDIEGKVAVPLSELPATLPVTLEHIQQALFQEALRFQKDHTFEIDDWEEFKTHIEAGGFVRCGWDGDAVTEATVQEETKATLRCILSDGRPEGKTCIYSGKPARYEVVFARAY